jgi:hypothetical protein
LPLSVITPATPIESWAERAVSAVRVLKASHATLAELAQVPSAEPSQRLAALLQVFRGMNLPAASNYWCQNEALKEHTNNLARNTEQLWVEYFNLAAAVDAALSAAVRQGARHPDVLASDDFDGGRGLFFVPLPADEVYPLLGVRGSVNVGGLGEDFPAVLNGLQSSLPQGHPLRGVPAEQLLASPQGPCFRLGRTRMLSPTQPRVPIWWLTAEVLLATQNARAQQLQAQEWEDSKKAWAEAQKLQAKELRTTPEQQRAEQERRHLEERLAAAERELAELRRHGVGR